jgi:nitroreductase
MTELDKVVRERRSTRLFLRDKPVPRELLDEALLLAMRAPSNSNVQPWRVFIASGPRRDRLVEALLEEASVELPVTTGIPENYLPLRRELGALVYGSMGIARHDPKAGGWRSCATGSSSARPWAPWCVCTATWGWSMR